VFKKRLTNGALVTLLFGIEIVWLAALIAAVVWLIVR
jgi:hypothetical protein